jgi:D-alanyl-D-alanine carboxypeptidase
MKTKIFKQLLFSYLLVFISLLTLQCFFYLREDVALKVSTPAKAESAVPMVLGSHITALRGINNDNVPEPALKFPIDTSDITARSFLVYNAQTGKTMLEKNSREQLSIASLTKLLTALVVYDSVGLTSTVTIRLEDTLNISPSLYLKPGDIVSVYDIFSSMLVGSANDAALALANFTSRQEGEPFAELMNSRAKDLGMEDSHFSNPYGFDSQYNYSTAEDLQKLAVATQKLSAFTNLGRIREYSFRSVLENSYKVTATNKLLAEDESIEAIKTGYTLGTQGAMIVKVNHNGYSFVIIVLGSKNRELDTLRIKEKVIEGYDWQEARNWEPRILAQVFTWINFLFFCHLSAFVVK